MDRNDVFLQGTIGDGFKYCKSERGMTFATFNLIIEPPQAMQDKGSESVTYIRIMVFKTPLVKYLQRVGAKAGNRAAIVAFIYSRKVEVKGETIIQNTVIARDINIIKTQ